MLPEHEIRFVDTLLSPKETPHHPPPLPPSLILEYRRISSAGQSAAMERNERQANNVLRVEL